MAQGPEVLQPSEPKPEESEPGAEDVGHAEARDREAMLAEFEDAQPAEHYFEANSLHIPFAARKEVVPEVPELYVSDDTVCLSYPTGLKKVIRHMRGCPRRCVRRGPLLVLDFPAKES